MFPTDVTYLKSLNSALRDLLNEDERVLLLGEDICDPYGGAYKVTKGLSTLYAQRVLNTPISEAGIMGASIGLAMRGRRPVVEIMFGDFLALCADQLLNSATKFPLMYEDVKVPLVVRTPMGGGRGYGPTHSQSIEKMFLGMPGLKVVAPTVTHSPGDLLKKAVCLDDPVLFLEHKLLYPELICRELSAGLTASVLNDADGFPVSMVKNYSFNRSPDVAVIGYGIVGKHLMDLLSEFSDEEVWVLGVFPTMISNPLPQEVLDALGSAEQIVVAEEAAQGFNWGSELSADIYERLFGKIKHPIVRAASVPSIIPASKEAESAALLTKDKLRDLVYEAIS